MKSIIGELRELRQLFHQLFRTHHECCSDKSILNDLRVLLQQQSDLFQRQSEALELLHQILAAVVPKPAVKVTIHFANLQGESTMPLSMPANRKDEKYFIIGEDNDGLAGAQLAPGQTVTVVSADPNTVALVPDATPAVDNEGVQSVASGSVVVGPSPSLNTPVDCTVTVLNPDGGTAETQTDTATITPAVPGVAVSVGVLFEETVSGSVSPTAAAKIKK